MTKERLIDVAMPRFDVAVARHEIVRAAPIRETAEQGDDARASSPATSEHVA